MEILFCGNILLKYFWKHLNSITILRDSKGNGIILNQFENLPWTELFHVKQWKRIHSYVMDDFVRDKTDILQNRLFHVKH